MKRIITIFFLFAAISTWQGCRVDNDDTTTVHPSELSSDMANDWIELTLDLTKKNAGFSPPVAARAFGYTGLALYESLVNAMPEYQSLQGQLNDFPPGTIPAPSIGVDYHWGIVANRAVAIVVGHLYRNATPANLARITGLEQVTETRFLQAASGTLNPVTLERSRRLGEDIGKAIVEYSRTDGQESCFLTNFSPSFVPAVFDGCWVPTPPAYQAQPLQPYWGDVRTFVPNLVNNTQPLPHPTFSTQPGSEFYLEAKEVYDVSRSLTTEQRTIAEFWADDPGKTATPPGHSMSITLQVLKQEKANLATAAEAYVKVGMALHDAFVSCWKCKYEYSLIRPVTYIRSVFDAGFTPVVNTPPFPEYTSGHSAQSGATSVVLTGLFGDNYAFTDKTHEGRTDLNGTPRQFGSFYEAADEAAFSRLYGGIHFRAGIVQGVDQGRRVGEEILKLKFKK